MGRGWISRCDPRGGGLRRCPLSDCGSGPRRSRWLRSRAVSRNRSRKNRGVGLRAVRFVVVALLVSSLTAVLAGPASGYVIGGKRWPGHVIRYHNAFAADRQPVVAAVKDWNTSGVDVRFVAVPASQAQVTIVAMPGDFFPTVKLPGVGVVSSDAAGFASVARFRGA